MDSPTKLEKWIDEFCKIVGRDNISSDDESRAAEVATFKTTQSILWVVKPKDTAEIQACLKLCNEHQIPVSPLSAGRNWGYGSRVPSVDKSIVLDLSRMNKITAYDEDLAYVTLEPGVTQLQLNEFLISKGGKLWMDVTSSSNDSSIIGNYVDRGHGITPLADHVNVACNFEVVLPSGEIFRTGYGRFSGSQLAPLDKWGLGPALDGLFTQSNFGIITSMTIWLLPRPDVVQMIYFTMDSDAQLKDVINALRPLRLGGLIRSGPAIVNDIRIITVFSSYPWQKCDGVQRLSEEILRELRTELGVARWSGSLGCFGSKELVEAQKSGIMAALRSHVDSIEVLTSENPNPAPQNATAKYWQRAFLSMNGKTGGFTRRPFWRKKTAPPAGAPDLDRDLCGYIWFPTTLPLDGARAVEVSEVVQKIVYKHGLEPDICFTTVRDRTLQAYMSITFDRSEPAEDLRAMRCQEEVISELAKRDYLPHRLGLHSNTAVGDLSDPEYTKFISRLKDLCDPRGVLSAGKYQSPPKD